MPEYRLYHFRRDHIDRAENIVATDDLDAIDKAGKLIEHQPAELWRGARLLKHFRPQRR